MRLHTHLDCTQVRAMLKVAKDAGQVTPDVRFMTLKEYGSKTHPHAFEVQLGTYDQGSLPEGYRDQYGKLMHVRRFKNSGSHGAASAEFSDCGDNVYSATWHEWGWFMARIFDADPDARFGALKGWHYAGTADFNAKTDGKFAADMLFPKGYTL